jgi:histidine triad (HIT) family protein
MGHVTEDPCPFCHIRESDVAASTGRCVAIWTDEPPQGSVMLIPRAHRRAPWDLTHEEWSATRDLLRLMMERVDAMHRPAGWNVGWNVGQVGGQSLDHVHCHLIPRYEGERYAGRGLRWLFKQPENAPGAASP